MTSTKRLIVLIAALLGIEGAAGSAIAGLYIEGDMDASTAILTVIISILVTAIGTLYSIMVAADKARKSKNRMARALGELIYQDTHGATPTDPDETLRELNENVKKLVELMMVERANSPQEPWEGRF